MHPSQDFYSRQPQQGVDPYSQQNPYAPQGRYPQQNLYTPQGPYPSWPGRMPYVQQVPYAQQSPYVDKTQPVKIRNRRARTAMTYGLFSIGWSLITLFTQVGAAGVITGTAAIIYGFIGLNLSKRLPNHAGRAQAIIGIILGVLAWSIVILSFALRGAAQQ